MRATNLLGTNTKATYINSAILSQGWGVLSTDFGMISAASTHHLVSPITAANYQDLGEVTNAASPVINNGVIVNLENGSKWTVTGTSYLSKLTVGSGASVSALADHTLSVTINGTPTPIVPGNTYTGDIELTVK